MRVLTRSDVRAAIGMAEAIPLVERAVIEHAAGRADIPPRLSLQVPAANGTCLFMPGYLPALGSLGHKIIADYPSNAARGLPALTAMFTLLDERTGLPTALMEASYLTVLRTGAVTGVALKYLAAQGARSAALLGTGAQARGQLEALGHVLPNLQDVRVWGRRREHAEALVEDARASGVALPLRVVDAAETAARGADILLTATAARAPVLRDASVGAGALVCAIGSHAADAQEVESAVVGRAAKVVGDSGVGALAAGDLLIPVNQGLLDPERVWDLGAVAAGERPGRERADELIVFKSAGFAALDLAVGKAAAERAAALRLGSEVDLLA